MTTLIKNPTQKQSLLLALKTAGSFGLPVWKIIMPRSQGGLGIAQYGARVYELRHDDHLNIINRNDTFYLVEEGQMGLGI